VIRRSGVIVVALASLLGLLGACKGAPHKTAYVPPTTTTAPAKVLAQQVSPPGIVIPPPTKIALAALASGPAVHVYAAPGAAQASQTLANPTFEGVTLAFFAVDQQGPDWYQVRLPERPNGTLGWVQANEVQLSPLQHRIVISVSQRALRVIDRNDQVLYQTNVAVGKPRTPTPLGRFYVDIWMPNPGRPYGSFLLSIAGFSDVLRSFGGGRGQVAMHGWADTSVMGQAASNGCVRMRNADISQVATLAPLGTPVDIVA
jgi:lipoprotein-anchoring transpeptidase ErfK/SrfK